jgi:Xaa-Pro aminopeptidase
MSNDVSFPYRAHSDLLWLTGFTEPDSLAALHSQHSSQSRFSLFVRERDELRERWNGACAGTAAAKQLYQPDECVASGDAVTSPPCIDALTDIAARHQVIYFDDTVNPTWTDRIRAAVSKAGKDYSTFVQKPPVNVLASLRSVKSSTELQAMRRAAFISSAGFRELMTHTEPGLNEGTLAVEFEAYCRRRLAARCAYPSIIANGRNALCLHYTSNNHLLQDGDLVLVDAGCEYHHYASDITRTFPVNGKFSPAQRDVYDAVLHVQQQCIDRSRADGVTTLLTLNEYATRSLIEAMIQLKIIVGKTVDECVADQTLYKPYWPHSVSHYLGMDVHDTSAIGKSVPLQPGMVITIEPGLYIPASHPAFHADIGIRIEDDVVIGAGVPEVITSGAPKTIQDIEELMRSGAESRRQHNSKGYKL